MTSAALKSQTITFGSLNNQTLSVATMTISATASSGLPVTFFTATPAVCTVSGNVVTLVSAGACTVTATQAGNSVYNAAPTVNQSFTIFPPSLSYQSISLTIPTNVSLGVAPFTVTAAASSGLLVTIASSTPAVCTVSGYPVTILAAGTCTLTATQAGNTTYAAAAPVTQSFTVAAGSSGPTITSIDNAASYASGVIAPGSYVDIFGTKLASGPSDPSLSITIADARGNQSAPTILYAGSGQVNIFVPDSTAYGAATLTLTNSLGTVSSSINIEAIAPGLFTVDSAATMPAAQVVTTVNGAQTVSPVANCTSSGCTLVPIVLSSSTPTYLILYGTGIRGATSLVDCSATIGGVPASVQYAGAQGGYPGLDQVNLLIPSSLAGRGQVSLNFSIFTTSANSVVLDFK